MAYIKISAISSVRDQSLISQLFFPFSHPRVAIDLVEPVECTEDEWAVQTVSTRNGDSKRIRDAQRWIDLKIPFVQAQDELTATSSQGAGTLPAR